MKLKIIVLIVVVVILIILGVSVNSIYSNPTNNTIRVAYIPCDHEAALFVALAQNTYVANGLNVKTTPISTGSNIVSALASGDIDVGYVGIAPAMQ